MRRSNSNALGGDALILPPQGTLDPRKFLLLSKSFMDVFSAVSAQAKEKGKKRLLKEHVTLNCLGWKRS